MLPLLVLASAAAAGAPPDKPVSLRECIAGAGDAAAMAACETREQASLRKRIGELSGAIRSRLDAPQQLVFDRNSRAWQAFADSEAAMLELSLGRRSDGLGPALRPAAITLIYEERVRQLREHLHNLTLTAPATTPATP